MVGFIAISAVLGSLFSIINLAESQSIGNGTLTKDTPEKDVIEMQWCGDGDAPQLLDTNNTYRIIEEQRNFSVRWKTAAKACVSGASPAKFTMNLTRPFQTSSSPHKSELSATGYLRVGDYYFPPNRFCVVNWTESDVTVQVCEADPKCGISNPCIPKCCSMNKLRTIIAGQKEKCLEPFKGSKPFNPIKYSEASKTSSKSLHYFKNRWKQCGKQMVPVVHETNQLHDKYSHILLECFRIQADGTLGFLLDFNWITIPSWGYCMDGVQIDGSSANLTVENFMGEKQHYMSYICNNAMPQSPYSGDGHGRTYSICYGLALLVASIFLLLTLVVYALLWKEQKIQGWTTMSHSATMFLLYVFLAGNHFLSLRQMEMGRRRLSSLCMTSGIFLHFFFLSNFCWLTIISFSLFWTFRTINASNLYAKSIRQYMAYVGFGWGLPLVFVLVSVILDQKYRYKPCNELVVPMYGRDTCNIASVSLGPYLYYPVAVMFVLNMIFFAITSYKLFEYKKSTSMARENLDKSKQIIELCQLFTKLFLVMGFTWILEFVSWKVSGSGRTWYWAVVDIFNILQGVAIFIIYVCKANIIASLQKNYPSLRPLLSITDKFGQTPVGTREAETTGTNVGTMSVSECNGSKGVELKSLKRKLER